MKVNTVTTPRSGSPLINLLALVSALGPGTEIVHRTIEKYFQGVNGEDGHSIFDVYSVCSTVSLFASGVRK